MRTITGMCRTNLDGFSGVEWPTEFVAVPRVGEKVAGDFGGGTVALDVVSVTHRYRYGEPMVLIELHDKILGTQRKGPCYQ